MCEVLGSNSRTTNRKENKGSPGDDLIVTSPSTSPFYLTNVLPAQGLMEVGEQFFSPSSQVGARQGRPCLTATSSTHTPLAALSPPLF